MSKNKKISAPVSRDRIDDLITDLNKTMKGLGRIDRGSAIQFLDPERLRTGVLGIDVASYGGLPKGGLVQFWGTESVGKTTTAFHVLKSEQARGEDVFIGAAEGFDKKWARTNGLWVPYSKEEYDDAEETGDTQVVEQMQEYDAWGQENGYGSVTVIQHVHGDGMLEAVYRLTKSNLYSVGVVDSLGMIRHEAHVEAEIGDHTVGGEAALFNRFTGKLYSALNTKFDEDGSPDPKGSVSNRTCVICLNQARVKFGASRPGQNQWQPVGGQGLKHAWHFSLEFRRGEELGHKTAIDGKEKWTPFGLEVQIVCDKSKIGPRGRRASWHLYTDAHEDFEPGTIDTAQEFRVWGVYYNVIQPEGHSYLFPDGTKVKGKDAATAHIVEMDDDTREALYAAIIAGCRRES